MKNMTIKGTDGLEIYVAICENITEFKNEMIDRSARANCWTKEEEPAFFVNSDDTAESMTIAYKASKKAYTWRYDDENEEGTCQWWKPENEVFLKPESMTGTAAETFANIKKPVWTNVKAAVYESANDFVIFGAVDMANEDDGRLSFKIDGQEVAFAWMD